MVETSGGGERRWLVVLDGGLAGFGAFSFVPVRFFLPFIDLVLASLGWLGVGQFGVLTHTHGVWLRLEASSPLCDP